MLWLEPGVWDLHFHHQRIFFQPMTESGKWPRGNSLPRFQSSHREIAAEQKWNAFVDIASTYVYIYTF